MNAYPPGTIGLSTIDGRTGALAHWGQRLMGAKKVDAHYTHTFLVGANVTVYEAEPAGVERNSLAGYIKDATESHDQVMFIGVPLTDVQRSKVVELGDALVARHVGYSWLSFWYLAARRLGLRTKWVRKEIARRDQLICSQLVDSVLHDVGLQLFTDGRAWMDVVPADIHRLARENPDTYPVISVVGTAP